MPLTQHDDIVQAVPPDRPDQPFHVSVLPRRSCRCRSVTNAHRFKPADERFGARGARGVREVMEECGSEGAWPTTVGLDFQRQYARKPARCQPITVSGLRIFRASSTPGAKRYSPANTTRSMLLKTTRFGRLRLRTLSWCRRIRTSASNAARDRNTPIRAHQINSQISFIRESINRFAVAGQPSWVCGRDRRGSGSRSRRTIATKRHRIETGADDAGVGEGSC